jgi:hypothetical protein
MPGLRSERFDKDRSSLPFTAFKLQLVQMSSELGNKSRQVLQWNTHSISSAQFFGTGVSLPTASADPSKDSTYPDGPTILCARKAGAATTVAGAFTAAVSTAAVTIRAGTVACIGRAKSMSREETSLLARF